LLAGEWTERRRLLPARQQEATLVGSFAEASKEPAITLVPEAILTHPLAWLEHRLVVVQDQQAALLADQLKEPFNLGGLASGGGGVGRCQEAEHTLQPFTQGRGVAQIAPVEALERWRRGSGGASGTSVRESPARVEAALADAVVVASSSPNQAGSNGVRRRGDSRVAAVQSAAASGASEPTVKPPP
jgi:hypothetical protein